MGFALENTVNLQNNPGGVCSLESGKFAIL